MNEETEPSEPLSEARQADERLVHAMLVHLHDGQAPENREFRVRKAMEAAAGTGRRPAWAPRIAWAAVAAAVLAALGLWALLHSPTPALASLETVLGSLAKPGDRTYRIAMTDQPAPPRPGREEDDGPAGVPRPGLDGAVLYLRDGRQYLLERIDPAGGVIFDGYDGGSSWRVRRGRLAEAKEGPGAGGIPLPPLLAGVPFSDLSGTLERIRTDYRIERFDEEPLPSNAKPCRHLLARRNSRDVKGPETIEIWADGTTGLPRRIVFDHAKIQGNRQPCRLTLDLAGEASLPGDWFTPAPHTAASSSGS